VFESCACNIGEGEKRNIVSVMEAAALSAESLCRSQWRRAFEEEQ